MARFPVAQRQAYYTNILLARKRFIRRAGLLSVENIVFFRDFFSLSQDSKSCVSVPKFLYRGPSPQ